MTPLFSFIAIVALCLPASAEAQDIGFQDLAAKDFAYEAALYLKDKKIMDGYADGTFRAGKPVNRAEAIKIIAFPLMKPEEEAAPAQNPFKDVAKDAWYAPHVEWARKKKAINGPPAAPNFFPERSVTKAEFLKMLLLAYGVDPSAFGEITLPLSSDVSNVKAWYYPYVRYSVASSMQILPSTGKYGPDRALTRGDVAVILHRFLLYRLGQRTQFLLDQTTKEIEATLAKLERSDMTGAEYASARALLSARGAHASKPEEPPVRVAVKIAEAIRALVRATRAGIMDDDLDQVIKHSQDAWFLADQARSISPDAAFLSAQIQTYASNFAESARKQKKR